MEIGATEPCCFLAMPRNLPSPLPTPWKCANLIQSASENKLRYSKEIF
jgi:hypothetical protein